MRQGTPALLPGVRFSMTCAPPERARDFAPTVRSARKGPFRSRPRRSPHPPDAGHPARRNTAFAAWPRPGGADGRPAVRGALGRASAPVPPSALKAAPSVFIRRKLSACAYPFSRPMRILRVIILNLPCRPVFRVEGPNGGASRPGEPQRLTRRVRPTIPSKISPQHDCTNILRL